MELLHRRRDLLHVLTLSKKHGLGEPDGFRAETIVLWTVEPLAVGVKLPGGVDELVGSRIERILQKRLTVEG